MFDYAEHCAAREVRGHDVVIVGGARDESLSELPEDVFFVHVNDHWSKSKFDVHALYHTVVTDHEDFTVELFRTIGTHTGVIPYYVCLNLVDGDYDAGRRDIPLWAKLLDQSRIDWNLTERCHFANGEWEETNPYGPQYEWLNELNKMYETKLFTGMVALAHVCAYEPRSVLVSGMDMFVEQTGGDRNATVCSHAVAGNLEFLAVMMEVTGTIKLSPMLREAMRRYGYEL